MASIKSLGLLERLYRNHSCQYCPIARKCLAEVDSASRSQLKKTQKEQLKNGSFKFCSQREKLRGLVFRDTDISEIQDTCFTSRYGTRKRLGGNPLLG